MSKSFRMTSGVLSRRAEVSVPTINRYADLGLLKFIRASDGTRLFQDGQEEMARRIRKDRMANRSRRSGPKRSNQVE